MMTDEVTDSRIGKQRPTVRSRAGRARTGSAPWRVLEIELNEDGTVGGSHQALYDLVRNMDRTEFEPVVLFNQDNAFVTRLKADGTEVHLYESERELERTVQRSGSRPAKVVKGLAGIVRRYRFLRRHRIDLVHVNNTPFYGNDDWLPAARLAGIPIVANSLGEVIRHRSPILRWLSGSFDRVMPNSDYIAKAVIDVGIPSERIQRVYPGIDIEAFRSRVRRAPESVRAELGVASETMLIAMVGNVREWKGQHVVLEALARLSEAERQRLLVIFVGATAEVDAPYEERLRQMVADNGLTGCARFLGRRGDVPDLMQTADVVLHASVIPEPFGLVVVEAMALGRPVVAADSGGPAEILTPGSGITFDSGEPAQLTDILRRLLSSPQLLTELGSGARERVLEFSIERHVAAMQAIYRKFLKRGRAAIGSRTPTSAANSQGNEP
jgi:glycosyltransferase involved in cell wall biosynthesis